MSDYLYYDNHTKSWSQPLKKAEIERLFIEGKLHAKDWCSGPLPTKDYQRLRTILSYQGYSSMAVDGRDTRAVEPKARCSYAIFERSQSPSKFIGG